MKRALVLLFAVMALVALVSCDSEITTSDGILNIVFSSEIGSRGVVTVPMETSEYHVIVSDKNSTTVHESTIPVSKPYVSITLEEAEYNVKVQALNEQGVVIGEGSSTANVYAGSNTTVNIKIRELSGTGTLAVRIMGSAGLSLSLRTLMTDSNQNIIPDETVDLTFNNGVYEGELVIPNGFYAIDIYNKNSQTSVLYESVRIVKGQRTEYESVIVDGSLVVSLDSKLSETPEISITLDKGIYRPEGTVLASATVANMNTSDINYDFWVLDNKILNLIKITDGVPNRELVQQSISIPADSLFLGEHVLRYFVIGNNEEVVWSESKTFTVATNVIDITGKVELFLVGNVLLPYNLVAEVKVDTKTDQMRPCEYRPVFEVEKTTPLTCSLNRDDYSFHFEEDYSNPERRIIYVVIDKEIENPGYIQVVVNGLPEMKDYQQMCLGISCDNTVISTMEGREHEGVVTITNGTIRPVKVPADTYHPCGSNTGNMGWFWLDHETIGKVNSGETVVFKNTYTQLDATLNIDISSLEYDQYFHNMIEFISFRVDDRQIWGYGEWDFDRIAQETQERNKPWEVGMLSGENQVFTIHLFFKDGVDEADFPYEIVSDISSLSVAEGGEITVHISTVNKT